MTDNTKEHLEGKIGEIDKKSDISNDSKPISKSDDSSKAFIMKVLETEKTHGFDVDSVYYDKDEKWMLFEYLKCENEFLTPHSSHPSRYPWNWRKFYSLFQMAEKLGGQLILVNYSDRENDMDQVRVLKVRGIDYQQLELYIRMNFKQRQYMKSLDYLTIDSDEKMTFDEYKEWLKGINKNAKLPNENLLNSIQNGK